MMISFFFFFLHNLRVLFHGHVTGMGQGASKESIQTIILFYCLTGLDL